MKPYLIGALSIPFWILFWIGLGHVYETAIYYSKMGGGY